MAWQFGVVSQELQIPEPPGSRGRAMGPGQVRPNRGNSAQLLCPTSSNPLTWNRTTRGGSDPFKKQKDGPNPDRSSRNAAEFRGGFPLARRRAPRGRWPAARHLPRFRERTIALRLNMDCFPGPLEGSGFFIVMSLRVAQIWGRTKRRQIFGFWTKIGVS